MSDSQITDNIEQDADVLALENLLAEDSKKDSTEDTFMEEVSHTAPVNKQFKRLSQKPTSKPAEDPTLAALLATMQSMQAQMAQIAEENKGLKRKFEEKEAPKPKTAPKPKAAPKLKGTTPKPSNALALPSKQPTIIQQIKYLSPWQRKTLEDQARATIEDFQIQCCKEVQELARKMTLCPAKFMNDRQCTKPKRPTQIDPDEFCAKCRKRVDDDAKWRRPAKVRKVEATSMFKLEDFIDDEAEEEEVEDEEEEDV